MRAYGANGLFAGLPETVDRALKVNKFASITAALNLSQRGFGARAATLVPALYDLLDRNWIEALKTPGSRSLENFRWPYPQCYVEKSNPSREVSFERALIRTLVAARRNDWSNQVPLISGIAGPRAFKRRAVDLVHKCDDGCFEFIELKIDSDTPVFAAVEILVYGLLWLLTRRDRQTLGYSPNLILDAQSLRLSVLAPRAYYSRYSVGALCDAINGGLRTLRSRHDVEMEFRFTTFPSTFYWSSKSPDRRKPNGGDLIALLDGRENL